MRIGDNSVIGAGSVVTRDIPPNVVAVGNPARVLRTIGERMGTAETRPGTRRGRRNDPDRRDRIIDACLDVIAEAGVAGVSHRKIADAAGVPLGSMTYHFDGMSNLLHEAFSRFSTAVSE